MNDAIGVVREGSTCHSDACIFQKEKPKPSFTVMFSSTPNGLLLLAHKLYTFVSKRRLSIFCEM